MCENGCCGEIVDDFVPLEEITGPLMEYHFDSEHRTESLIERS